MKLELDHERLLHWHKKPMRNCYELKESPRDLRVVASLKVSRLQEKGYGICNGKNVRLHFVRDGHY